jgi:hypothetical protein
MMLARFTNKDTQYTNSSGVDENFENQIAWVKRISIDNCVVSWTDLSFEMYAMLLYGIANTDGNILDRHLSGYDTFSNNAFIDLTPTEIVKWKMNEKISHI